MSLSACASRSLFSYQMLSLLVSVQSTALSCVATLLKSVGGSGSLFSVVSVLSGVVTLWGSENGSCNLLAVLSFMCPTTRAIWSNISSWCSWPAMNPTCWRTTDDLEVCFFELVGTSNNPAAKGARSLAISVTWTIWCDRNRRVFNEEAKSAARIIDEIKEASRWWISAGAKHLFFLVDRHISE